MVNAADQHRLVGACQPPLAGSEASRIRIVIVDDSRLYREAIADLLGEQLWVASVETVPDAASAMVYKVACQSTVTLLNMATEGSLDCLQTLSDSGARVVVMGVRETEAELLSCAELGSTGFLLRSDSLQSLCCVIQAVARGETICSPKTTAVLLRRVAALAAERRALSGLGELTSREAEILDLIEQGNTNRDIAKQLQIEVRTVKNHVHAILDKLRVQRRGQAAALARAGRAPVHTP
jgi:two-component system, NarL family, nitrate/nitrite response regulator NarL